MCAHTPPPRRLHLFESAGCQIWQAVHVDTFAPSLTRPCPLSPSQGDIAVEKTSIGVAAPKEFVPDMIFEQEPSQLLNAILPLYLNGQILRTLQESVASELASRMTAMQSATDNAKELQKTLELQMNRARQAKITQELMEIIAGADSV